MRLLAVAALALLSGIVSGCVERAETKGSNKSINPLYQTVDLPSIEDRQRLKRSSMDPYGGLVILEAPGAVFSDQSPPLVDQSIEAEQPVKGESN